MKKIIIAIMAICIGTSLSAGDILTLNNNYKFEGKVKKIKDCSLIFKAEGQKFEIPATEILSVQFEDVEDKVYTDYLELTYQDPSLCLKGQLDAESYHGKKGGHVVLGFLFGPFAMLGTALANPTPDKGKQTYLMSQNKEHFTDLEYISCYKKKAKGQS